MELFIPIVLFGILLAAAICAYCLCVAVSRNIESPETVFLLKTARILRKFIVIAGPLFMAFCVYSVVLLTAVAYRG